MMLCLNRMKKKGLEGAGCDPAPFCGKYSCLITFCFTLAILVFGMILAGMFPGGRNQAIFTDTMDQMSAMQIMLARHIFRGESIFYSWETSFGQNTSLLYAFCAYSPFTVLFAVIPDIYIATIIGILLKIALSAMLFHLFIQYGLGWHGSYVVFFSVCYGLCGYQYEYMLSSNLLDALYLLPLVMLALMHAIRKSNFVVLCLAYSCSFIIQFYCGFLIGLFSAIAMIGYLIIRDGHNFLRKNLKFFLKYFYSSAVAILLSMILLMPAISFFMSSTGFNSIMNRASIKPWDIIYAFYFGRSTSITTDIPYLYCGIPVLLLLPLYFCEKRIELREKIVMALAVASLPVSLYSSYIYFFLHAFNRPDGFTVRYAFVYIFIFVVIAIRCYSKIISKEIKFNRLLLYFMIQLCIAVLVFFLHDKFSKEYGEKGILYALCGTIIFFLLWALVLVLKKRDGRRFGILAMGLLAVELLGQAYYNCREQGLTDARNAKGWDEQTRYFVSEIAKDDNSGGYVYRAHLGNSPNANQSALYDYMGIGQFASSNYAALQSLMSKLGDAVSSMRYTQAGATDATDMIFGVRYRGYLTRWNEDGAEHGPRFEIYKRALPIAYMVSDNVLNIDRFDGNPFENQNRLISALCGERIKAYTQSSVWTYLEKNAEYLQTDSGYEIRALEDDTYAEVLLGIPMEEYEHAYVFLQLLPYEEKTSERLLDQDMATNVAMFSPADRKASGGRYENVLGNAIMEMTKDGNAFVVSIADFEGKEKCYRYTEQYFCYQEEKELDKAYHILSQNPMHIESINADEITGKVRATPEQSVLFTTVPYDKGWSIFVDGDKVIPISVINDTFIAVELSPGEHEIIMRFEAEGKGEGILLFSIGAILLLIMLLHEVKNNKCMNTKKTDISKLASCEKNGIMNS